MRFSSTTAISLFGLIVGSSALLPGDPVDPGYTRSWDFAVDSQGKLGRAPSPVLLDNGQLYMANSSNQVDHPVVRFQLIGLTSLSGELITAAKLVGYPGYDTKDQGLYMWQPEGGTFVYGPFEDSPVYLKSWWFIDGPTRDPQFRLTLEGNSAAKVSWDDSKKRYNIYIGSGIPVNPVQEMIDVQLKVTAYCGPGPNDYCF